MNRYGRDTRPSTSNGDIPRPSDRTQSSSRPNRRQPRQQQLIKVSSHRQRQPLGPCRSRPDIVRCDDNLSQRNGPSNAKNQVQRCTGDPIVFCSAPLKLTERAHALPNVTGVAFRRDIAGTIAAVRRLHPSHNRLRPLPASLPIHSRSAPHAHSSLT